MLLALSNLEDLCNLQESQRIVLYDVSSAITRKELGELYFFFVVDFELLYFQLNSEEFLVFAQFSAEYQLL